VAGVVVQIPGRVLQQLERRQRFVAPPGFEELLRAKLPAQESFGRINQRIFVFVQW